MAVGAEQDIVEMVREAARGVTARFDRKHFLKCAETGERPQALWDAMAEQGLLALGIPEEYGGQVAGITGAVAAMEALSEAGTPPALYIVTVLTRSSILAHGTADQKERFVRPTVTGEKQFCFAMTEPTAGTNSFAATTRASRVDDDTYRINGQKVFITGVDQANVMMVSAKTEAEDGSESVSLFVLDLPAKGIHCDELRTMTMAPDKHFAVYFEDVEVPAANRIGEEGAARAVLFNALNPERYMVAAHMIGLGNLAIEKGVTYAKERAPFGAPIGSYQAIQHPLADAATHLAAARLMMYEGSADFDAGRNDGVRANMTKYLASLAANKAIDASLQAHGGYAFDLDYDIVTLWPKIRLGRIAPINNEMILNYISERVLGLPRSY